MNRCLVRVIALFLIPGLLLNSGWGATFLAPPARTLWEPSSAVFTIAAVSPGAALSGHLSYDRPAEIQVIESAPVLGRRRFLTHSGIGRVAGLALAGIAAAQTTSGIPHQTAAQLECLSAWRTALRLERENAIRETAQPLRRAAWRDVELLTNVAARQDPEWAELKTFMAGIAETLRRIARTDTYMPEYERYLSQANDHLLTNRGWLLTASPSEGFSLAHVDRYREVTVVYGNALLRWGWKTQRAWIGAQELLPGDMNHDNAVSFGPWYRRTVLVDSTEIDHSVSLWEGLFDPSSTTSRSMSEDERNILLEALQSDGWIEPVASRPGVYRWRRSGYREALEAMHMEHEIAHGLTATSSGAVMDRPTSEACGYLSQFMSPQASSELALMLITLRRSSKLQEPWNDFYKTSIYYLAETVGGSGLAERIKLEDATALDELIAWNRSVGSRGVRRAARSARREAASHMDGAPTDWDIHDARMGVFLNSTLAAVGLGAAVLLLKLRTQIQDASPSAPAPVREAKSSGKKRRHRVEPKASVSRPNPTWRETWNARWPRRHVGDILSASASILLWYSEEMIFRDFVHGALGEMLMARVIGIVGFALLHPVLQRLWHLWLKRQGRAQTFTPEPLWMSLLRLLPAWGIDASWGHVLWGLRAHYVAHYGWNLFVLAWNRWTPVRWPRLPLLSLAGGESQRRIPSGPAASGGLAFHHPFWLTLKAA